MLNVLEGKRIAGNEMQSFYQKISKWREELESQGVDSGTTSDAIQLITYVQNLKKELKPGQETVRSSILHFMIY